MAGTVKLLCFETCQIKVERKTESEREEEREEEVGRSKRD